MDADTILRSCTRQLASVATSMSHKQKLHRQVNETKYLKISIGEGFRHAPSVVEGERSQIQLPTYLTKRL